MKSMRQWLNRLRYLPVGLVMSGIFYLSHQPGGTFTLPAVVNIDKLLHCLVYTILGVTFYVALSPQWRSNHPVYAGGATLMFCLVYGISDEWHQSFIAGREVSGSDVAADVGGGLLAVLSVWAWRTWRRDTTDEVA
ncbi:VanZ family protein [Desulfobulbus oligotrophicus]|uniref:VanZ family protein n=1 Tax=Desulfobulbus oligotrophicus TaxID=1909699 RepID=A0A7T5VFB9_9BACT|nr:VanZ family protein [Desulfobulbus oligotrophicus]QQG66691.1 VanZ family protein [Desulfobulbus oligotrophicus]